jgi:5-methylcytosine-specific restriction endonuclease McrA
MIATLTCKVCGDDYLYPQDSLDHQHPLDEYTDDSKAAKLELAADEYMAERQLLNWLECE